MFPSIISTPIQEQNLQRPLCVYTIQFLLTADKTLDNNAVACRNYVLKNGPFINVSEPAKDNRKAILLREEGNKLYTAKKFNSAIEKYNESICYSENGSEHLAIGYANRSAVCFQQKEYFIALENIKLAKDHNYPDNLMPKLLTRENKCREMICDRETGVNTVHKFRRIPVNLPGNPRIPFLADGIVMRQLPGYGRSMIADRNFRTGNVILQEKALFSIVNSEKKYLNCDYCTTYRCALIPCPHCVSVMFCSQECQKKAWRFTHRFECGISEKLHHLSLIAVRLAPRMFFYALTLFDDNVERMMKFCKTNARNGSDPLSFDYTKYNPIEEFKLFQKMYIPSDRTGDGRPDTDVHHMFHAAVFYSVYIQHPLVRSIFVTEKQKLFMIRGMQDYFRSIKHHIMVSDSFVNYIFPVASICNHSCDPNLFPLQDADQLKYIVNRPIAKGEQITVSYGPLFRLFPDIKNLQLMNSLHFDCICDICNRDKHKMRLYEESLQAPIPEQHYETLNRVIKEDSVNMAAKLNALEQFIERFFPTNTKKHIYMIQQTYKHLLTMTFAAEMLETQRSKLGL